MNKHFDFNIINKLKDRIKNNNNFENTNPNIMKSFKKNEEKRIYLFCASYASSIYITS